jgi:hypothetical protein
MHYGGKICSKLEERIKNCNNVIERELEINGNVFDFIGYGLEMVKEEKGIIKLEPSEAGSRVSIWGEVALPFELVVMSNHLGVINGELWFGIIDSLEGGRVVRYKVEDEIDFEDEIENEDAQLESEDKNANSAKNVKVDNEDKNAKHDKDNENNEEEKDQKEEGKIKEISEISVNKNGEYQIDRGKIKSEDNGRKLTLSMEYVTLVIEGFGQERRLTYTEKTFNEKKFIVEIKSIKEINAIKRKELLDEFQRIAEEVNGDKHGMARGVAQILHENDVKVAMPISKT